MNIFNSISHEMLLALFWNFYLLSFTATSHVSTQQGSLKSDSCDSPGHASAAYVTLNVYLLVSKPVVVTCKELDLPVLTGNDHPCLDFLAVLMSCQKRTYNYMLCYWYFCHQYA